MVSGTRRRLERAIGGEGAAAKPAGLSGVPGNGAMRTPGGPPGGPSGGPEWHQRIPLLTPKIAAIALGAALSWTVVLGLIWLARHLLVWLHI
jgi:hypothetical protein